MMLIVGLGNPGTQYANSRHNAGFEILARLAKRAGSNRPKAKFEGEIIETQIGNEKITLLCPLTYMNLSGRSVKAAMSFYQLPIEQVLVVCDDFNLDVGRIRIRKGGSSGGQNGLSDVIEKLGSDMVPRLRFGIGQPPPKWEVKNYVLSKFDKDELEIVHLAFERAADAVECWIGEGIQVAMNRFNSQPENKSKKNNNEEDDTNKKHSSNLKVNPESVLKKRPDETSDTDQ